MPLQIALEGFGTGMGLIVAIGAQNAFVLKQGLMKRFVFMTALMCTLIDFTLITLGVLGLGKIIEQSRTLLVVVGVAGAIFLIAYGVRSIVSAIRPRALDTDSAAEAASRKRVIAMLLAFSLLNPHVYLDTVLLLGSIGARHASGDQVWFILGAGFASATWFFALAYGARVLSPLFKKPLTWRVLDLVIAVVLFVIAVQLLVFALNPT